MATLYFIRGVPGAGKSTFAKTLADSLECEFLEADHFFYDCAGEYKFDATKLYQAHMWCQRETKRLLTQEDDVIVSNTSTTEKEVKTYQDIANETGAKFVSLIVENRHGNKNVHDVPDDKVELMKNRFSVKL